MGTLARALGMGWEECCRLRRALCVLRQVVWQSAFVLAEYLLRAPPFGQWADVRAVDLGTGTGA